MPPPSRKMRTSFSVLATVGAVNCSGPPADMGLASSASTDACSGVITY